MFSSRLHNGIQQNHSSCNTLVKNTKMEFFKYIAKLKHKNEQNKINNTYPKQNQYQN